MELSRAVRLVASVLLIAATGVPGSTRADPPIPMCNQKVPDLESMSFCDGGVQNTCEDIQSAPLCTGNRKVRELVTQDCVDDACYNHCMQNAVLCWKEHRCVWNQSSDQCESGEVVDESTTMAKTLVTGCARAVGCQERQ